MKFALSLQDNISRDREKEGKTILLCHSGLAFFKKKAILP
jgi:hypothetical protein